MREVAPHVDGQEAAEGQVTARHNGAPRRQTRPTGGRGLDLPDRAVDNGGKSRHSQPPMDVYIEWICYERANRLAARAYYEEY